LRSYIYMRMIVNVLVFFFKKDKKLAIAKCNKAKRIDYALKYIETASRCGNESSSTSLLNVRDQIIKDFRQRTKYKFMRSKNSFTKVIICAGSEHLLLNFLFFQLLNILKLRLFDISRRTRLSYSS